MEVPLFLFMALACSATCQRTNKRAGVDTLVIGERVNGTTYKGGVTPPESSQLDCECVPYYDCKSSDNVSNSTKDYNVACDNSVDICCMKSFIIPRNLTSTTPQVQNVTENPIVSPGCGKRRTDGPVERIQGSKETQFGEFPWMVAILKQEFDAQHKTKYSYKCGGSLIHPRAVLTAAHCVRKHPAETLKIRAGEWDTQSEREAFPHQDLGVGAVVVHEQFYSASFENDYAILVLSQPVKLTETVNVICLPEQDVQFDQARCTATGWGKNVFGKEGLFEALLKKIELPVVDRPTCQKLLRKDHPNLRDLHDSLICAGGEAGEDTCTGDGGSPLVCPMQNDPDRYYQAGIVSWGFECGKKNTPGLYANVARARDWIDAQLNALGLTNSY